MQHRHAVSRDEKPEDGFTLIELMMVVLIIAILIAVLIPTFVGAKYRAQDASVKADLRNGLTAEKTSYTDTQKYTTTTATLQAIEPALPWGAALTVSVGDVVAGDSNVVCLQEASKSGTTYSIADVATGASSGTYYNKGTCSTTVATVAAWTGW